MSQFVAYSLLKIVLVVAPLLGMVAYAVLVERKVSAFIQDPCRAESRRAFRTLATARGRFQVCPEGRLHAAPRPQGLLLARARDRDDSVAVDHCCNSFGSNLGTQKMVIADLNVGILYTFGIVSLGVYGIVLAGYASNSKYPFLGGIRSSAQMISYEIAMGMSVIPVFMIIGSLRLSDVITYQAQNGWFALPFVSPNPAASNYLLWPFTLLSFAIFVVAAFAETNRLPFDLPESETELVGGYHTEYSSLKFGLFFMGEYAAMIAVSAMMVVLFLGGWTWPWWGLDQPADTILKGVLHIGIFLGKLGFLMFLFIWVRWMLPRFRYDQLMDLGWRRFIPLALANIVATAVILWFRSA
jgi:NADH-quinone oxidoreductase subunit H